MTADDRKGDEKGSEPRRKVPVAWEALEDAFENNAPEVHSYLHQGTGEVIRVVDGIADPQTHARIAQDGTYLRVDPVSSREQYRWMERFIATVEEGPLRTKLLAAIDGKGAFRRFKDVLMTFPVDRERWFTFRSERLRTCMESWLEAQGVESIERPEWQVPTAEDVKPVVEREARGVEREVEKAPRRPAAPVVTRAGVADGQRRRLRELVEALPARELETAAAFLEFLRERRPLPRASMRDGREDGLRDEAHDRARDHDDERPRYRDDELEEN